MPRNDGTAFGAEGSSVVLGFAATFVWRFAVGGAVRTGRIDPEATVLPPFERSTAGITFGGIGASISTTVWENRTALHHAQLVEQVNPYNPAYHEQLNHLMQMGMSQAQAVGVIERSITQQAAMLGANDIFWISGMLFFVLIGFVWLTRPARSGGGSADAMAAH